MLAVLQSSGQEQRCGADIERDGARAGGKRLGFDCDGLLGKRVLDGSELERRFAGKGCRGKGYGLFGAHGAAMGTGKLALLFQFGKVPSDRHFGNAKLPRNVGDRKRPEFGQNIKDARMTHLR